MDGGGGVGLGGGGGGGVGLGGRKKKFSPNLQIRTSEEKPALNRSYSLTKSGVFQSDKGFAISKTGIQESPASSGPRRQLLVRQFDELQMMEVLGHGAGGVVNKATHKPSGVQVAVKSMDVLDDDKRHQMMRELKTLYSCTCDNIVNFYGAFYDDCHVYVVLEYMDAGSLADLLRRAGHFPESVCSDFARQLVHGLFYLHRERHQVHRDIKPANMLCDRTGRVQLSDFGVAAELSDTLGQCETFLGTARYMAPETLAGNTYSYPADIWAVGICLVEFANGAYPYASFKSHWDLLEAMNTTAPPRLPNVALDNSPFTDYFKDFISLCLQLDPEERANVQNLVDHPFLNMSPTMNQLNRQQTVAWISENLDRYSSKKSTIRSSASMDESGAGMDVSGGVVVGGGEMELTGDSVEIEAEEGYDEESFEDYQPSPTSPEPGNGNDAMADFHPVLKKKGGSRGPKKGGGGGTSVGSSAAASGSMDLDALMQSEEGRQAVRDSLDQLSLGAKDMSQLLLQQQVEAAAVGHQKQQLQQKKKDRGMSSADHPLNSLAMRQEMDDDDADAVLSDEEVDDAGCTSPVARMAADDDDRPAQIMMSPAPKGRQGSQREVREIRPTSRATSAGGGGGHPVPWMNSPWNSRPPSGGMDPDELAASVAHAVNIENDGALVSARGATPPMLAAAIQYQGGLGPTLRPSPAGTPKRMPSMTSKSKSTARLSPGSAMATPRSPLLKQTIALTEQIDQLNTAEQQVLLDHVMSKLGQQPHSTAQT